jgi:hypothetical protein
MEQTTWATVYDNAVTKFGGQTPGHDLEQTLLVVFTSSPATLNAAIDRAAQAFASGKAHSPWGIVRSELQRHAARADITTTGHGDQAKRIALAERYIQLAGHHIPSQAELLHELFGPSHERGTAPGHLHPWQGDHALEQRMVEQWQATQALIPPPFACTTDDVDESAGQRDA